MENDKEVELPSRNRAERQPRGGPDSGNELPLRTKAVCLILRLHR